ncbi:MAG: E3 binding domain-containing protein [Porticoccaceae bacterium]
MAVEIVTVPDLGGAESVDVIELNLTPGDAVELEDSLIVLESDKASMDVPSTFAGSLVKYLVADGATVKVGDAIAEIETGAAEQSAQEEAPVEETSVEETSVEEPQLDKEPKLEQEPQPAEEAPAAKAPVVESEQLIVVPDIGSDDEVDLIEISIAIGDQVEEGDTLVVLESDKATMDVPSSHSGKVIKILAAEGDKLRTGSQVAILQVSNAEAEVIAAPAEATPVATEVKSPSVAPAAPAPAPAPTIISAPAVAEGSASADVYAGPSVRMLARELGVSLEKVSGTGPRGRIQKNDVDSYVKNALNNPASASTGSGIPEVPVVDFCHFGEFESIKLSKIQ